MRRPAVVLIPVLIAIVAIALYGNGPSARAIRPDAVSPVATLTATTGPAAVSPVATLTPTATTGPAAVSPVPTLTPTATIGPAAVSPVPSLTPTATTGPAAVSPVPSLTPTATTGPAAVSPVPSPTATTGPAAVTPVQFSTSVVSKATSPAPAASATSPPPTATTTPPPSAAQLLKLATAAVKAKGSAHVVIALKGNAKVSGKGLQSTTGAVSPGAIGFSGKGEGDETSTVPVSSHLTGSITLSVKSQGTTQSVGVAGEAILVGSKVAYRQAHGAWSCQKVAVSTSGATGTGPSVTSIGGTNVKVTVSTPTNLGAKSLNGTSVWLVRQKAVGTAKNLHETVRSDTYINQSDNLISREVDTVTLKGTQSGTKINLKIAITLNLSNWGETVHVALPSKCGGTAAAMALAPLRLLVEPGILTHPQSLLRLVAALPRR